MEVLGVNACFGPLLPSQLRGSRKCAPLARLTGLPRDSVANVSQIVAVDKDLLTEQAGKLPRQKLELLLSGIDVVLER